MTQKRTEHECVICKQPASKHFTLRREGWFCRDHFTRSWIWFWNSWRTIERELMEKER
jgi:hypothetical protein